MVMPNQHLDTGTGPRRPADPLRPGLLDRVAGETDVFVGDLKPYLPFELIGGVVPAVPGLEDEAVWNAASQACGTEKVHYAFSVDEGKCWYIACPSSSLASAPDSWCPLAAALPGHSEYWDKETVYIYEQEGVASALRWDQDTGRMQVFVGASRTLLPRIQTMDANFVAINPAVSQIAPWRNRSLRTEKLSRASVRLLLMSGLAVDLLLFLVLFVLYLSTALVGRNLDEVRQETDAASTKLMENAYMALQSKTTTHFVRIQQLLGELQTIDGTLVRYEVNSEGNLVWEALVPASYSGGVGSIKGKVQQGIEKDGRVRIQGSN